MQTQTGGIDNLTGHAVCAPARFDLERRSRQCPSAICLSFLLTVAFFSHHHTIIPFQVSLFFFLIECHSLPKNPSVLLTLLMSVIFFSACLSVRRTFLLASSSVDCSLNCVCVCVCVRAPQYRDLTDQKQACVSGGHCVPWPHPHSALGYSVWA